MPEPSARNPQPTDPGETVLREVAFSVVLPIYVTVTIAISWLLSYGALLVDRRASYEAAACAIREAVPSSHSWRARRLAEREAVLHTMERFGLITRTRGCASRQPREPAGVL